MTLKYALLYGRTSLILLMLWMKKEGGRVIVIEEQEDRDWNQTWLWIAAVLFVGFFVPLFFITDKTTATVFGSLLIALVVIVGVCWNVSMLRAKTEKKVLKAWGLDGESYSEAFLADCNHLGERILNPSYLDEEKLQKNAKAVLVYCAVAVLMAREDDFGLNKQGAAAQDSMRNTYDLFLRFGLIEDPTLGYKPYFVEAEKEHAKTKASKAAGPTGFLAAIGVGGGADEDGPNVPKTIDRM